MGQSLCTCHKKSPKNSEKKINIYKSIQNNSDDFQDNNNSIMSKNLPKNNDDKNIYINNNINDKNKIINDLNTLDKKYNDIKLKNNIFYDDIEEKEEYISNYRAFLTELNNQINNLKDYLNIRLINQNNIANYFNKDENNELINDIENISNKINEMELLLENQKIELKNLEGNFKIIQEQFNMIRKNEQDDLNNQQFRYSIDIESIKDQMNQIENIITKLHENKMLYNQKKIEIESDINILQNKTEKKIEKIKTKRKKNLSNHYLNEYYNDTFSEINDSLFSKGSMLLRIKDFSKAKKILNSIYLSNNNEPTNSLNEKPNLIIKNWHETCYINDEYDIHDIYYDLKAVGLPSDMVFSSTSFCFVYQNQMEIIEIILFEIDERTVDYDFQKYSLRFNILLKNLESKKIHIIYKELPLYNQMNVNQKELRNIFRKKFYGLSHTLVGLNAKYILINSSSFEIINFGDEFFIKNEMSENIEYQWQGKIPENGKKTLVRLSLKEGHFSFHEKYTLKSINNSFINNSSVKITKGYKSGNNKIIKYGYKSKPNVEIKVDEIKNFFEVQYINTNSPKGEFIYKGKLINRCKGEWTINLTDEEIDNLIPNDYKTNKEKFKTTALDIINKYDEEHRDGMLNVSDAAKIGKWVKKNIKYDITYTSLNYITATETLNLRKGVCHHITKLFNALMYSLNYQVIYILGFIIAPNLCFSRKDTHAWSLIKIDGKWLPFDITNGILSSKLPIIHIFKQIGSNEIESIKCLDKVEFEPIEIKGNFI